MPGNILSRAVTLSMSVEGLTPGLRGLMTQLCLVRADIQNSSRLPSHHAVPRKQQTEASVMQNRRTWQVVSEVLWR